MKRFLSFAFILLLIGVAMSGTVYGGTGQKTDQVHYARDGGTINPVVNVATEVAYVYTCTPEAVPAVEFQLYDPVKAGYTMTTFKSPAFVSLWLNSFNLLHSPDFNKLEPGELQTKTRVTVVIYIRCRSGDVMNAGLSAIRAQCDSLNLFALNEISTTDVNTGTLHSWFDID